MRIVMPLFGFSLEKIESYSFSGTNMSIGPMLESDIVKIPFFSEQDLLLISNEAKWAIFYDDPDTEGYKSKVNILLMAFKIFCPKRYPFIKYILCSDYPSVCRRLCDTITYNYSYPRTNESFNAEDLNLINKGFLSLIEMDKVSIRTHNTLYFLYRAWHNTKWMDSFILMMCSLESLFSKDKPGGVTAAITTRVSSLLKSKQRCTKRDIGNLYELRSRMTHGNIKASEEPGENLKELNHLEFVTIECFRTLVEKNLYKNYVDKTTRDKFMSTLNTSTKNPGGRAIGTY